MQQQRGPEATSIAPVVASYRRKRTAIRAAQREGVVSDRFSAETLLELILALIQTHPALTADPADEGEPGRRRQAIKDAVGRLVRPEK